MDIKTHYKIEFDRWLANVTDTELLDEMNSMDDAQIEDAFYQDLSFGTGGLRGIIGAGTNRMNSYVVAKASQGLANYLGAGNIVVIGFDSRIKSDVFAKEAAKVFAANGIKVFMWKELMPVPLVSYAVRSIGASAGIMITASHNPRQYNGYKVYGADGCQITTENAEKIFAHINALDTFEDIRKDDFDTGIKSGVIAYIDSTILDNYINDIRGQSVLYGDYVDREVEIVYTPLNGTGLIPVTRALNEVGFTNITVVEEQRYPDGNFPTCPYPNPEIKEAMTLGLQYCRQSGADLLLATDPDCDRCGIAVRNGADYKLLTGNEVGVLLLDYICSQKLAHNKMPVHPVFVKTIVTTDMAEKIAKHYGLQTINVLTGFKFVGETIGILEEENRLADYICGFEESYGYLTGTYVRDKDGVNAAYMICEMFAYYKARGIRLLEKLEELYDTYGFCLNTLHTYKFEGGSGFQKMQAIMNDLRKGGDEIGDSKVICMYDYLSGLCNLPPANVIKYMFSGMDYSGSLVIRPSGTEPKLKVYIEITTQSKLIAHQIHDKLLNDLESRF